MQVKYGWSPPAPSKTGAMFYGVIHLLLEIPEGAKDRLTKPQRDFILSLRKFTEERGHDCACLGENSKDAFVVDLTIYPDEDVNNRRDEVLRLIGSSASPLLRYLGTTSVEFVEVQYHD